MVQDADGTGQVEYQGPQGLSTCRRSSGTNGKETNLISSNLYMKSKADGFSGPRGQEDQWEASPEAVAAAYEMVCLIRKRSH